jgi:dTDP-4-amino-4,6-dideoxygalactose transaminase
MDQFLSLFGVRNIRSNEALKPGHPPVTEESRFRQNADTIGCGEITMPTAVMVPFVDLRAQYATIREEIEASFRRVLEDASFIQGPDVAQFEEKFASYLGAKHAVGVANGTDALLLTLKALGIGNGDEVLIPANTFVATAEAIVHAGARPILVDISPETYTIDVHQIEDRLTSRTKAIIPVHLYGQPADLGPILTIAETHGIPVIEDAAQAHGAEYGGRRVGAWGRAACFSFYPAKNLGAYGDAGAVVTNDDHVALAVRKLRDHGGVDKYRHDLVGYNSRLDTLQAAVLLVKLKHLDGWNQMRRQHARLYDELLATIPGIVTPARVEKASHVYHLYVIRVGRGHRDELQRYLHARGIHTSIHYPAPVHLTAAFADRYPHEHHPVAERCANEILSLPMYPELERKQIHYVHEQISKYMQAYA